MWDWSPIREWLSDRITPYWTFPLLTAVQGLMVVIGIILVMAYYTLAERKVIGWIQARKGPNRVNLLWIPGAGQPFADVFKLLFKEILIPADASGFLFRLAPFLSMIPAIAIWAVIPLSPERAFANIDAGLLYVLALTSMGVYGIILAGWAANSKYAFLGAMRSAAQIVAYEIAMGFAMVGVLMAAGSLNIGDIIQAQHGGPLSWNWFWLFPLMMVYFISGVAETNRAPFDVAEGESEIVAGFHVDYSGMAFALFFIAEYVNMILISALTVVFFLGGWLSPFDGYLPADAWLATPSFFWFGLKTLSHVQFSLVACDVSALPVRPNHAAGLESLDPGDAGMVVGRGLHGVLPCGPVEGASVMQAVRSFFKTFLLWELLQGLSVTLREMFQAQGHDQLSGGEDPAKRPFSRSACAAPLPERRGALHRLQAVRSGVSGTRHHHRVGCRQRRHAPDHALRHRPVQVHLLRILRGGLSGGCHRRDPAARIPYGKPRREHHEQGQAARRSVSATKP